MTPTLVHIIPSEEKDLVFRNEVSIKDQTSSSGMTIQQIK